MEFAEKWVSKKRQAAWNKGYMQNTANQGSSDTHHPSYLQCSDKGCGFLKPQQMQRRTIYFIELGAARSSVDVVTFQIW